MVRLTNLELKARIFGLGIVNPNTRFKKTIIKDIPIMITQNNKLLCIPNTGEVKHVGITGMTGTCKSLFLNSLMFWDYWHMNKFCINLNDFQRDTFEQSLPTESFQNILDIINTNPCPMPLVYVFPSTKTLHIEEMYQRFPFLKITLPIEEVIRNVENYHKLDRSKVYLGNIKEELIDCNSMEEIMAVLEENFPGKSMSGMRFKLLNIFENLFENKILNVAIPNAPAFLEYKDKEGNKYYNLSLLSLVRAGFIPSIQTSDLRNQEYFSAYMHFIVESIYNNQYEDGYFRDKTISLFVDEIDKLFLGHNGNLVKSSLNLIGTNGRTARIGLRWSTQNYGKIPDQIRTQTKYLFVSRKSHAKEVLEINKDFDVPKSMYKDISELKTDVDKGLFEIVALTTEKFILYDLETGERISSSMPQKGYLITSPSRHHVPNVEI